MGSLRVEGQRGLYSHLQMVQWGIGIFSNRFMRYSAHFFFFVVEIDSWGSFATKQPFNVSLLVTHAILICMNRFTAFLDIFSIQMPRFLPRKVSKVPLESLEDPQSMMWWEDSTTIIFNHHIHSETTAACE